MSKDEIMTMDDETIDLGLLVDTVESSTDDVTVDFVADDGTEVTTVTEVTTPTVKVNHAEVIYAAVVSRDVDAAVAAIVAAGKNGAQLFLNARTMVRDGIDAAAEATGDDPDFDALKTLSTFRNAVDAAVAALGPVAKVAADPTTGPVMAIFRAAINAEKVGRVLANATVDASKVGVTADMIETRMVAHFATHGVTITGREDVAMLTDAELDKVLNASRGGRITKVGGTGPKSDRLGADTFPCNGAFNPLSGLKGWHRDGDIKSHIIQAVTDNGGTATLQQINKAITTAYPQGIKSDGAVRNAFMRGVEGFEMTGTKGNYVCRKV